MAYSLANSIGLSLRILLWFVFRPLELSLALSTDTVILVHNAAWLFQLFLILQNGFYITIGRGCLCKRILLQGKIQAYYLHYCGS